MKLAKKAALWCLLIICIIAISGCNTIRGAGEDIEQGGKAIQNAAGK